MGRGMVQSNFYVRMGLVLIALIFAGFLPFIFKRYDAGGALSPLLAVHGALTLGWFALFTYQAALKSMGNMKLHKRLGTGSLFLAVAIVITGVMVTQHTFDSGSNGGTPFTPEHFIILPVIDLLLFTVFYILGYMNRRQPIAHKHYMLLTGIMIMDPAVARLAMTVGFEPLMLILHIGLIGTLMVHDRRKYGSIQKATKIGLLGLVTLYATILLIGPTEAWAKLVHMVFG